MKKKLTIILFFIILSCSVLSCIFSPNGKISVDNTKRTFTIHTPKGYSNTKKPYPVLFVFHGNPSKGWQMKLYTGMNKTANKNNFIVVYPDALDNRWSYNNTNCKKVNVEIRFIEKLLDELNNKYNVDSSRVYFSGMSGGGFFLSVLANKIPEKIAAMTIIAGNRIEPNYSCMEKELKVPIPFLLMHGTSDHLYNGQSGISSAEKTIDYWVKVNQCDTIPIITKIPNVNKKDSSSVLKIQYLSKIDKDVTFYKIENGGHHWPNSSFNANSFVKFDLGKLNKDFDTNKAIWDFVSSYKKNNTVK